MAEQGSGLGGLTNAPMDRWTNESLCVPQEFVLFGAAALLPPIPTHIHTGLSLVIFLTEHSGLSPHNFKEPGRKTESPIKQAENRAKVADGWAGAINSGYGEVPNNASIPGRQQADFVGKQFSVKSPR